MNCPYCQSKNFKEVNDHPYPYFRKYENDTKSQLIIKYVCECGYPFFTELRNKIWQIYKQGLYQFKGE